MTLFSTEEFLHSGWNYPSYTRKLFLKSICSIVFALYVLIQFSSALPMECCEEHEGWKLEITT